jgi:hypothetical protein
VPESPVYIDRRHDDPFDEQQPWLRRRREPNEREWSATTGGTAAFDGDAEFDAVEHAIRWGRERDRSRSRAPGY